MAFFDELCSTILFMLLITSWLFLFLYYILLHLLSTFLLVERLGQFVVGHARTTPCLSQLYFLITLILRWSVLLLLFIWLCFQVEIWKTVQDFLWFHYGCCCTVLWSFHMIWLRIFHCLFQFSIYYIPKLN